MSPPGPARLYASVAGPILLIIGLAGFLRSSHFSTGIDIFLDRAGLLGMDVNGWINLLHVTAGLALLAALAIRPRLIALLVGGALLFVGVAGRRASIEDGTILFDLFAVDPAGDWFRIVIGGAGVLLALFPVAAAQQAPRRRPPAPGRASGAPHPNAITFEELRSHGASMDAAARFVQARERLGGFRNPEELAEAPGLPHALAEQLRSALSPRV